LGRKSAKRGIEKKIRYWIVAATFFSLWPYFSIFMLKKLNNRTCVQLILSFRGDSLLLLILLLGAGAVRKWALFPIFQRSILLMIEAVRSKILLVSE
jgi:hypothetical protein